MNCNGALSLWSGGFIFISSIIVFGGCPQCIVTFLCYASCLNLLRGIVILMSLLTSTFSRVNLVRITLFCCLLSISLRCTVRHLVCVTCSHIHVYTLTSVYPQRVAESICAHAHFDSDASQCACTDTLMSLYLCSCATISTFALAVELEHVEHCFTLHQCFPHACLQTHFAH